MTLDEASALVGDDIGYWLSNPFLDRAAVEAKVCWWIERAAQQSAAVDGAAAQEGGAE
jgi:hypothetical protein